MKKYTFLFLLALPFLFTTCNENMPEIACLSCPDDDGGPDDIPPQVKKVLVEEFTGVRCINCPAGSIELENLLDQQDGRLIAVSIHAEFFANPYPENQYDFRTPEGEFIINFLGLPEAYPSAVIDRKLYSGESDLQLVGLSSWAGRVGQQVQETAKVSLIVENDFDSGSRQLMVHVMGQAQEAITEEVRLTIMITENGVVDAQLTPESSPSKDLNYVHKHVLRKVITDNFDGDVVGASMIAGDLIDETYSFTLPDGWDAEKCEVIAFTHLAGGSKEVLQAVEEHVTE